MATTENLERLEGLVRTLTPLADKQRGELIEAADWNQLVDSVLEVARASLAQTVDETVPQHEHTDMVGVEWLTPKLRGLVSGGGLSDPASASAIAKLERKVDRLAARMDELSDKLGRVQADLAGVQTKDVVRQNEVTELGRKVDGVRDSRDDIAILRSSLDGISADVRTAVAAVGSLQSDGQLIDVAALVGRVDALDGLRDALTTPAGNLLSAAEYERRLEELRAQLVTEQELRNTLEELRGELGGFDAATLLDEAKAAGRAEVEAALDGFRDANSSDLDRRFAGLEATLADRVTTATEDLATSVLADARGQWEPALSDGLATLESNIARAEGARDDATRTALSQDISRVEASVAERASNAASDAVGTALAGVTGDIAANRDRLAGLADRATANTNAISANATKLETTRRNLEAADARLQQTLSTRIAELENGLDGRIDSRTSVLRDGLREDLRNDVAALGRDLETRLGNTIRGAVVTEVGVTSGRLRSEISSMVDTEVAAVREDINTKIQAGLATNAARMSGMVTNEVRRATADLDGRVERAVNAFLPELERIVTDRPIVPPRG